MAISSNDRRFAMALIGVTYTSEDPIVEVPSTESDFAGFDWAGS